MIASCDVPRCDRPPFCRGYCRAHYARLLRHGDVRAEIPIEAKTTGGVGYWACHERVKTQRGPASAHRCTDCGAPARDWSYDGADPAERVDPGRGYRYSLDVDHYRPRCRSCHRRATVAQARPRGRSAPVVDIERAIGLYRKGVRATGIARVLGTSRTAAYTALRAYGEPMVVSTSTDTTRYGLAQAQAWDRLHPRLTRRGAWADHDGDLPTVEGTLIRLQVARLPGHQDPKPLWLWWSKTGAGPADVDRCWQAFLRRFDLEHLPAVQADPRLDRAQAARSRRRGPLDLADHHRAHPTPPGPRLHR